MKHPPHHAIEVARLVALKSPCAKSKRGVVLFDDNFGSDGGVIVAGEGFNGQPAGFACSATDACRRDCAKLCLHAEDRAIRDALVQWGDPTELQMLHVKVVGGAVVPGGGPSCWQCSRLVVELGLRGVWLYEEIVRKCYACGFFEDSSAKIDERLKRCPDCRADLSPIVEWCFYTAEEFHCATLATCGLGDM